MKYYIIDDTPNTIRQIKISLSALNHECFWIDEIGNGHDTGLPPNYLDFTELISEEFKENICKHINEDSIFLIDLALNYTERQAVEDKYIKKMPGALFTANTAAKIIEVLKTNDPPANVRVISGIWKNEEICQWMEALEVIKGRGWFEDKTFVPSSMIMVAHHCPSVAKYYNL